MSITNVISNTIRNYTYQDIKRSLTDPETIISEINQIYNHWRAGQRYNPDGIDIFDEDWDTLIILDACRYDEFQARSTLDGRLEHRISRGSTSPEFVRGNFSGKTLHDVVYVSANAWFAQLKDDIDAEVHSYEFVDRDAKDGITSKPETVTAAALDALSEYPNKRLIIHYMQPHWPYLGPTGDKFPDARFFKGVRSEETTHEDIMQAYRENLDLVLEEVETLLDHDVGKTVVTADHGELLGDREKPIPIKAYRHPEGIHVDSLVKVPWQIFETDERRVIKSERPESFEPEVTDEQVTENLRDLGYM
ncbi:hypothetical protein [Halocatena halophila]|uniref:hypothetical protein n=1 Tax=Halocatena halophila TaxID=2814576 RepID=UPI002ED1339B